MDTCLASGFFGIPSKSGARDKQSDVAVLLQQTDQLANRLRAGRVSSMFDLHANPGDQCAKRILVREDIQPAILAPRRHKGRVISHSAQQSTNKILELIGRLLQQEPNEAVLRNALNVLKSRPRALLSRSFPSDVGRNERLLRSAI